MYVVNLAVAPHFLWFPHAPLFFLCMIWIWRVSHVVVVEYFLVDVYSYTNTFKYIYTSIYMYTTNRYATHRIDTERVLVGAYIFFLAAWWLSCLFVVFIIFWLHLSLLLPFFCVISKFVCPHCCLLSVFVILSQLHFYLIHTQ